MNHYFSSAFFIENAARNVVKSSKIGAHLKN